jgi:hypothetical protein
MTYRLKAQSVLRGMRNGVARLNRLLVEGGSSDEDLVFHIRNSDREGPLSDRNLELGFPDARGRACEDKGQSGGKPASSSSKG